MITVQNNHTEVQAKPTCKFLRTGQKIKINAAVQTIKEQLQPIQNQHKSKLLKKASSFMSMTYSNNNSYIENKQKCSPSKLFSTIYSPEKKSIIFGGFEQLSFDQNIMLSNQKKSRLQSLLEYSEEKPNQLSSYLPAQHSRDSELLLDSFQIPTKQPQKSQYSPLIRKTTEFTDIGTKQSSQSNYELTFKKSPYSLATPYTYQYPDAFSYASWFHHVKYFTLKYQHCENHLILNYHGLHHPSVSQFYSNTLTVLNRIKSSIHNKKLSPLKFYKYLIQTQESPFTSLKECLLLHNIPFNSSKQIQSLVHYFFTQQNLEQLFEATFFQCQISSTKVIKLKHNQYQNIYHNLDDSLEIMTSSIKQADFWYLVARINEQSDIFKSIEDWISNIITR